MREQNLLERGRGFFGENIGEDSPQERSLAQNAIIYNILLLKLLHMSFSRMILGHSTDICSSLCPSHFYLMNRSSSGSIIPKVNRWESYLNATAGDKQNLPDLPLRKSGFPVEI